MKITCLLCGETFDLYWFDVSHKDVIENKNRYYKETWVCIEAD